MKPIFLLLIALTLLSCGTAKQSGETTRIDTQTPDQLNRGSIPLLTRIRKLPGISLRNGVPVITKATNTFSNAGNNIQGANQGNVYEPLYILNDYPVGNSFRSVEELVDNFNVKKIEVLNDTDASFYGSRAASGVIKITTYE